MKSLKNMTGDSLEQMIDYKVVDQDGASIGTLHSLWSDPTTGGVEFLGVKTGWLFGHNHVVPAEKAELDEANNFVRLPYTEMFIKEAPSIPADAEISEMEEDSIYQYYGLNEASENELDTVAIPESAPVGAGESEASAAARWRRTSRPETMAGSSTVATGLDTVAETNVAGEHANPDLITGEPGAHPVGTGVGAMSAGMAGLAIGAVAGGPVGAPIGAAIGGLAGAIGGGFAGKGIAEAINPTEEDAYWGSAYQSTPYYQDTYDYADYAPAYRAGYEGFGQYGAAGREYGDVEPDLEQQYQKNRGTSKLEWSQAKPAVKDAWERLKDKFAAAR